jgi:hypothetical protein
MVCSEARDGHEFGTPLLGAMLISVLKRFALIEWEVV